MPPLRVEELTAGTWPGFERLVEKHRGVWGGCWCIAFDIPPGEGGKERTAAQNKAEKEELVRAGRAHAALVYDGKELVGWCQFGPPAELPARMTNYRRLGVEPPDWRIPCFFVDRDRRHQGVAKAALQGALRLIAQKGGGTVDAYPVATRGEPSPGSFIWGGTETMFAREGFRTVARLGPNKRMMRKVVPLRGPPPGAPSEERGADDGGPTTRAGPPAVAGLTKGKRPGGSPRTGAGRTPRRGTRSRTR